MTVHLDRNKSWGKIPWCVFALIIWCGFQSTPARADGIGGFLEYGYSTNNTTTTETSGTKSKTKNSSFLQRYLLNMDRSLYPQLRFSGGGLFEKTMSNSQTDTSDMDTRTTRIVPRGDLVLSTPFYNAGIGYTRREEKSESTGSDAATDVVENYNAKLSLRPEGLPGLNLLYSKSNYFDKERISRNTTSDTYTVTSTYSPIKNMDLSYNGNYTNVLDEITTLETKTLSNNARIAYGQQFFNNRASLYGTYNIAQQSTETLATRVSGTILSPMQLTTSGLFNNSLAGSETLPIVLANEGLLTDKNISVPAPSTIGLTIGAFQPLVVDTSRALHFGLDLSNQAKVNTIVVTVNQNLEAGIAVGFTWRVFTSTNNSEWNEISGPITASFTSLGTATQPFNNSFSLSFGEVTTRYIKVVIVPRNIPQAVVLPSTEARIFVAELQAFLRQPASEVVGRSTNSLAHLFDLNGKVRLLKTHDVAYEFFYNLSKSETDLFTSTRSTLSNAIRAQHQFNRVFTGTTRISREDSADANVSRTAYIYSASLLATPLPVLSHTLVYSGKTESSQGKTATSNSFYLSNFASPYRGVDLSLSAGYSINTNEEQQRTTSTTWNMGGSFVPNPKLTMNIGYSGATSKQSGGATTSSSPTTTSHRGDITAAFNPVKAIYLYGSWGISSETGRKTQTTQSYGGSWGMFRDGALQLNFAYSETLNSTAEKSRSIVPSLRWNIRPGSYLDLSYLLAYNESVTQDSTSQTISASLRIGF